MTYSWTEILHLKIYRIMETIKENARLKIQAKISSTELKIKEYERMTPYLSFTQEMIDGQIAYFNRQLSEYKWIKLMING